MLGRLALLCLRPAAEGHAGLQWLCSAAAACQHTSAVIVQPAATSLAQQHQQFSSTTTAVQAKQQQQQQQPTSKAADKMKTHGTQLGKDVISRMQAAEPTEPALMVLKAVLAADKPLTSHELFAQMQQQYGSMFPTRNSFKKQLRYIQTRKWVAAVAPAHVPRVKGGKTGDSHYVYIGTASGYKVDLNMPGLGMQAMARSAADEWTRTHLPRYAEHLRAGRVAVSPQNLGVLPPQERRPLFQKQLLGLQPGAVGAAAGSSSSSLEWSQYQHKQ